jgi:hypothetical protein
MMYKSYTIKGFRAIIRLSGCTNGRVPSFRRYRRRHPAASDRPPAGYKRQSFSGTTVVRFTILWIAYSSRKIGIIR